MFINVCTSVLNLQKVSRVVGNAMQGIEQSEGAEDGVGRCVTDLIQLSSKELHHYKVTVGLNTKTDKHTHTETKHSSKQMHRRPQTLELLKKKIQSGLIKQPHPGRKLHYVSMIKASNS